MSFLKKRKLCLDNLKICETQVIKKKVKWTISVTVKKNKKWEGSSGERTLLKN